MEMNGTDLGNLGRLKAPRLSKIGKLVLRLHLLTDDMRRSLQMCERCRWRNTHRKRPVFGISCVQSHLSLSRSGMISYDMNTPPPIVHVCARSVARVPRGHREKHICLADGEDRFCSLNTGLHVVSFGGMVTLVGRGKEFICVTLSQQVARRTAAPDRYRFVTPLRRAMINDFVGAYSSLKMHEIFILTSF